MRKLKIMEHISLDGVIQISAGPTADSDFPYGDWTAPYRSPAGLALVTQMYGETFDLVIGRRTYDQWSSFWPKAPRSPMADRLNAATKYVATHRPESLEWGPFESIGPDLVKSVRDIKAKDGADLIVSGSSTLTSALLEHGLADELVLLVDPVLLGKGRRLFAEGTPPRSFALQSSEALPSGIVVNIFKAAGPLQNLKYLGAMAEQPIPVFRTINDVLLVGTKVIYDSQAEVSERVPHQWREFRSRHPALGSNSPFFGASPCTADRKIHYLTGIAPQGQNGSISGERLTLEAGEYAVVRVDDAALLRDTWIWLLGSWLPTSGRRERHAPEFEKFTGISEVGIPIGPIEIWIPLEPLATT